MGDSVRKILAANIRKELKAQGLSVKDFAAAVSRSQVYDILARRKGCTVDMLDKMARVLMVQSFELLKGGAR